MKFESPDWLYGLWSIPALLLLRVLAQRAANVAAGKIVAGRLRAWLVSSASAKRSTVVFALQIFALACLLIAAARPIYGKQKIERPEKGKNLMFVIDTSRSMLANDVQPNRLMKAKLATEDILTTLEDYRVGVVAYAGRGYLQAPLTSDHEAVIETLHALDTEIIPRGGSVPSEGIREALTAFKKTKAKNHGVILFSDGGDEDRDLDKVLEEAKREGVTILTIGVGTSAGSLIPDPEAPGTDQVVLDPQTGQAVRTRLDDRLLRHMAEATGGRYFTLGSQSLTGGIIQQVMSSVQAMEAGQKELTRPIQRFYLPLALGIVALMSALLLRPLGRIPQFSTATAAAVIWLVGASVSLSGKEATGTEAAREAYEGKQFQRARDVYARQMTEAHQESQRQQLAYGLAASAHQLKDYDRALENYSAALQSSDTALQRMSHRGMASVLYDEGGKALAQQPEFTLKAWEDSLRHYDAALKIQVDNKTALNRRHVEEQLKKLREQMEQQKQQQQQKQKGDKSKQEKQDGQQGDENEEGGEPQDGQQGKQPQQSGQDGQQQEGKNGEQGEPQQQNGQQGGKEGEQQQQQQTGKDGDQQEGQQGKDGQEQKMGEGIPDGQIQAQGNSGMTKEEIEKIQQMLEDKVMDATGFSRNQARDLIRTYSDQMAAQFRRRREPPAEKDW
ncbi:MAG: VWA domain-containing protein [Verrucomicrobiaceae bacterium]|nr:VWA domain-containing protein [Verrucomicrobiaceae bacterium]